MQLPRPTIGLLVLVLAGTAGGSGGAEAAGYYREPAIHGETVVFTAEGDQWTAAG